MNNLSSVTKAFTLCFLHLPAEERVLLLRRRNDRDQLPGVLNGLGGKLAVGETPLEGAAREIREESGLMPLDLRWRGTESWVCQRPDGSLRDQGTLFLFSATRWEGELISECVEGTLAWYPQQHALDDPDLAPNLGVILPQLLDNPTQHYAGVAHYIETGTHQYELVAHGFAVW